MIKFNFKLLSKIGAELLDWLGSVAPHNYHMHSYVIGLDTVYMSVRLHNHEDCARFILTYGDRVEYSL